MLLTSTVFTNVLMAATFISKRYCSHQLSIRIKDPRNLPLMVSMTGLEKAHITIQYPSQASGLLSFDQNWRPWTFWFGNLRQDSSQHSYLIDIRFPHRYADAHPLYLSLSLENESTQCGKTILIPCQHNNPMPYDSRIFAKHLNGLITMANGRLVFQQDHALWFTSKYIELVSSKMPSATIDTSLNSPLEFFEQEFKGFVSLRSTVLTGKIGRTRWDPLNPLTALLDSNQSLISDGKLFVFDGPDRLYVLPKPDTQELYLHKLLRQNLQSQLGAKVERYELKNSGAITSHVSLRLATSRLTCNMLAFDVVNPARHGTLKEPFPQKIKRISPFLSWLVLLSFNCVWLPIQYIKHK